MHNGWTDGRTGTHAHILYRIILQSDKIINSFCVCRKKSDLANVLMFNQHELYIYRCCAHRNQSTTNKNIKSVLLLLLCTVVVVVVAVVVKLGGKKEVTRWTKKIIWQKTHSCVHISSPVEQIQNDGWKEWATKSSITVQRYHPDTWNVINLQIYRFLRQSAKVDIKSLTFY